MGDTCFHLDQHVWLSSMTSLYSPYVIEEIITPSAVCLKLPKSMIIHSACHVSQLNPVSVLSSLTSMFCLSSKCLLLLLPLLPVTPWCVIFLVALLKFSFVILKLKLRFRFGIILFPHLSAHPLTALFPGL